MPEFQVCCMILAFQMMIFLAQAAEGAPEDPVKKILSTLLLPAIIFIMMWLLVIRPYRKEEKTRKDMITSLAKGDTVVTSSGIHGKVVEFRDNNETVVLNISKDTNVVFNTSTITKKK